MSGLPGLGTIVATIDGPTPLEFEFIISEESARENIESGSFVQVTQKDELVIAVIQTLRRTNRYFSSPDVIHGSSQGYSVHSIYPSERWDYIIARAKVLGSYKNNLKQRSTKPVLPGSKVSHVDDNILRTFLGIDKRGLKLGKIRQSRIDANISLDRLLQKHLAILSISGGGKSYATSVIIEEILRRNKREGRPAVVIFDVHGEYSGLAEINGNQYFKDVEVMRVTSDTLSMALGHMRTSDFGKLFPTMSPAQMRELGPILSQLKFKNQPFTVDMIISKIFDAEMNPLVKEALLGWMNQLKSTYLFSNEENPNLEKTISAGKLIIFDLSDITSLWKKRIILHYFLSRLFELRRSKIIPPVVSFIEEAHQFAPEVESSSAKSIIHTIAREGRKFLCSLVLVSQRPVNLSTTALSQCNSHLILRILNPYDLNYIGKTSEGINQETLQMLTSLGVGEGLLVGEAVNYPVFVQIRKKLFTNSFDDASMSQESARYERSMKIEN